MLLNAHAPFTSHVKKVVKPLLASNKFKQGQTFLDACSMSCCRFYKLLQNISLGGHSHGDTSAYSDGVTWEQQQCSVEMKTDFCQTSGEN